MRTITRKTNVRRHDRHLPSKTADVRKHQRTVTRQMLGTIPVKNLTFKQGKKIFRGLPANQDWDGDGVPNKKDCRPFDEERQDDIRDIPDEEYYRKLDKLLEKMEEDEDYIPSSEDRDVYWEYLRRNPINGKQYMLEIK